VLKIKLKYYGTFVMSQLLCWVTRRIETSPSLLHLFPQKNHQSQKSHFSCRAKQVVMNRADCHIFRSKSGSEIFKLSQSPAVIQNILNRSSSLNQVQKNC